MSTEFPKIFFDQTQVDGVASLIPMFGHSAFASPFRSTIPLVALVKDDWPLFRDLAEACGSGPDPSVHFEYKVYAPGVVGNPSQTDALILTSKSSIAVEAKWTEPRYETVAKRLKTRVAKLVREDVTGSGPEVFDKHNAAQRAIINSWLGMLGTVTGKKVVLDDAGDAIYQMIHRAASACAGGSNPTLLYLHFDLASQKDGANADQYRADLLHLFRLIGSPANLSFYFAEISLFPTKAFHAIESLRKRAPGTDTKIRESLKSMRLFNFGEPQLVRIGNA